MKFFKYFFILLFFLINLNAKDIKPIFVLETRDLVYDFVLDGSNLFVSNAMGTIEVFDLFKQKKIDEIVLPPMYNVHGEQVTSKILSVDRHNGKTLFVSTTLKGFRDVWLHDGMNLKHIIKAENKLAVREARFIDDEKFILGTVAHEMILYNMSDSYKTYRKHLEQSTFSDVVLSEDRKTMITSSESGRVTLTDVKSGEVIKIFESQNVDNIYKIDYKNGNIITAGQDRRVGVYPKNSEPYYIKSDFLVYTASLSPSGNIGVYSSGEENNLQVFNVNTKKKMNKLIGHYSTPTTIKFIRENELFSAGDENRVFYWKID
ncbi:WD40 repeat domain-containing protein [Arcobacter sp. LA11]|uniref:WD40 repeat domain-containing protein n=1 Tax=Arcobacter sp. LA11 TaxID=1898176 RepID=UPI00093257E6|nr:WD40 repeat domain-containing protein [Arcobacter sp. LA11]